MKSQLEISVISDVENVQDLDEVIQANSLLKDLSSLVEGKIIIVEDQPINMQVLKAQMQEMNLL